MKICFAITAALASVSGIAAATPVLAAAEASSPVATVQFADDSDAVDAKAAKILDEIAEEHRAGKSRIIVKAHADRSEGAEYGPEYGRGLSHRRASEVRSYLSTHGINPGKIDIEAFGVDKPKGTSSAANRRAEIYVIP